jgi:hypothetical protein
VYRLGDLPVGVEATRFSRDAEGDVRVDVATSTLVPTSPQEALAEYTFAVEWSDPEGALINAVNLGGSTEEETKLDLRWSEERGWHVQGRFQSKDLDADVAHEGSIHGRFADLLALSQQLVPRGSAMRFQSLQWVPDQSLQWVPDLDPTKVQEARLEVLDSATGKVRATVGPVELSGARGDDGLLDSGVVTAGRVQMNAERVYRNGGL